MAHQLWDPLVNRFRDSDILVIEHSFVCLVTMSSTCKDFILKRALKEAIPSLLNFLNSQLKISHKKQAPSSHVSSAYAFTVGFRFQLAILDKIGQLVVDLSINQEPLWRILDVLFQYLSCWQPKELQDATISSIKLIHTNHDKDSIQYFMWRYSNFVYENDASLKSQERKKSQEYRANISFLQQQLLWFEWFKEI